MLKLKNVTKVYEMGDYNVRALRGVTLAFRESEFVSIIGASGCGKSTLLNIIGGLDRYTTGDLIIGNTSTESFRSEQWDAYRNATIGFVFQNYNLIPHLTVLENVELALSLSGVDKASRRRMAQEALERVGMGGELRKKPSQISGGQMQRVAIARALVNNPKIVLADEPTGALDSKLSVQVMELLKEVARDRLVIMVTHNNELANTYSTRIVKLRDGLVESDSMPYEWEPAEAASEDEETDETTASADAGAKKSGALVAAVKSLNALGIKAKGQKNPFKATSMKAGTAFSLSLKNLLTKKRRTFLTSFAGSVGIISLALVLAMSNGFNLVLDNMQASVLATVPIGIYEYSMDYSVMTDVFENYEYNSSTYPDTDEIYLKGSSSSSGGMNISDMMSSLMKSVGRNDISEEFVSHLKAMGKRNWDSKVPKALAMLSEAREQGLRVSCDAYPYTAGSTQLIHILPHDFLAGGTEAITERLRSPRQRKLLTRRIQTGTDFDNIAGMVGWENILCSTLNRPENRPYQGLSIAEIARRRGKDPFETAYDLLVSEDCEITMIDFIAAESDIERILQDDQAAVISDSTYPTEGQLHPRVCGTFARVIERYVGERGVLSLPKAVRKMTALPAQRLRLRGKGLLRAGWDADLCIFDPANIHERGTYQDSCRYAEGMDYVLVDGIPAIAEGSFADLGNGRVICRN